MRKPAHIRRKVSSTVPEEAIPVIEAMRAKLKMTMAQLIDSLLAYACWCEKEHHLTGQAVIAGGAQERAMWAEIVRDFGKPGKTGSYFEHAAARHIMATAHSIAKVEPPGVP